MIFVQGLCCTWVGEAIACEDSFPLELGIQLKSHLRKAPELCSPNTDHQVYLLSELKIFSSVLFRYLVLLVSEQF